MYSRMLFMGLVAFSSLFVSCSKDDENKNVSKLSLYLTDDPANYQQVNIDVQSIQVKFSDADGEEGWVTLNPVKKGVYNLLDFSNGMDTLLTTAELPAGKLQQIRLVLGSNNTVKVDGTTHNLTTPSAQQSGLKLKVNADLVEGIEYKMWLDFDAGKSIVTTGSNKYILKPVIRAYTQATSGSVKGVVTPVASRAWVYTVTAANDTIATAAADTLTGFFGINGLPAASYSLHVDAGAGYQDKVMTGVDVSLGSVKDVGTINVQ